MIVRKEIGVKIEEDLWKEFRQYVKSISGKTHTALGNSLEEAIQLYMKMDDGDVAKFLEWKMGGAEEQKRKNKNMFKITKRDYFFQRFKETCKLRQEVNYDQIDHLCFTCDFISEATINKRIKELEKMGWIEPITEMKRWKNKLYREYNGKDL